VAQAGVNGTDGSSGTSGTSGTSPSVIGTNNQVLTSDGSGGITSESNLTFDGNSLLITDAVGTQNYGMRLDSTQNTQFLYTAAIITNTGGTATNVLTGIRSSVQDGQIDTIGIQSEVLGTAGNGIGVQILNSISNNNPTQFGSIIEVVGVEPPQITPLPPYTGSKYGSSIKVAGDALVNTGIIALVSDGQTGNQGIGVFVSGSSASKNIGIAAEVKDGQGSNKGITALVSGTSGDGTGIIIINTIDKAGSYQYGSTIEVLGVEVPPTLTPYATEKLGSGIDVSGDAYSNTGMLVNVSDGQTDNSGMLVKVSDGQTDNLGIGVRLGGTSGNGIGLSIANSITTVLDKQFGATILVNGAGSPSPVTGTEKTGLRIEVGDTAKSNTGLVVGASGSARSYAIITTHGSSVFNDAQDSSSDFLIRGDNDANLLFVSATNDAVGIGISPLTKLDVLGDYRFVHDPNVELPVNAGDPSGYGDIVTFGNAGANFAAGLVCYLDSSNNWNATDAGAAGSSRKLLALALGSSPADGMLIRGYAQYTGFVNAPFTLGEPLYLVAIPSPAPPSPPYGAMSNTAPTGTGEIVRIVGYCVGDTAAYDRIYFNPSNDWIEL
jgi:hypothetical protein